MRLHTELVGSYYAVTAKRFVFSESRRSNWYILASGNKNFRYRLGDSEGTAGFGEMLLCPPGWTLYRESPEPLEFLSLEFAWYDEQGIPYHAGSQKLRGRIRVRDLPRYASTLKKYKEIMDSSLPDLTAYKTHLLNDLLYACLWESSTQPKAANKDLFIDQAIHFLEAHASEPVSLKKLAERAALSPSQFSRRFQAAVGVPPIKFLTAIRLKKAETLLLETDFGMERISAECGYQSGFYFSRVFAGKYGMAPSRFREMYRV